MDQVHEGVHGLSPEGWSMSENVRIEALFTPRNTLETIV